MPAIVVEDLRKDYGPLHAVDGVSFEVADGEVCALLGPNGAGKTTTVEILEGHRTATSGTASVLGMDPATGGRAFRERIGIVLQEAGFDESQTVHELVAMYAGLFPRYLPPDEVVELVGLGEKRRARVASLSGGQRRRLDLALGLVGAPQVLFLDEPTTGFDPAARRRAWTLVERLRELGTTVLLTTHYLDEAQHLADHVVVINRGRVVWRGTPEELIDHAGAESVVTFRLPDGVGVDDLPDLGVAPTDDGGVVEVVTPEPVPVLNALTGWALARGIGLPGLGIIRRTLEEAYLDVLGDSDGNSNGEAARDGGAAGVGGAARDGDAEDGEVAGASTAVSAPAGEVDGRG
jgi:ABC-2 type transport system ATP-binding protein